MAGEQRLHDVVIDDLLFEIFFFLNYKEFDSIIQTCKYFHNITNTDSQLNPSYHRAANRYWKIQSTALCINILPQYKPSTWRKFFFQLRSFLLKTEYISNDFEEFDSHDDDEYSDDEDDYNNDGHSPRVVITHRKLPKHLMLPFVDEISPLIQACIGDSPMVFEMLLSDHRNNDVLKLIDPLLQESIIGNIDNLDDCKVSMIDLIDINSRATYKSNRFTFLELVLHFHSEKMIRYLFKRFGHCLNIHTTGGLRSSLSPLTLVLCCCDSHPCYQEALEIMAENGRYFDVNYPFDHAPPAASYYCLTPLAFAAKMNQSTAIEILIRNGADIFNPGMVCSIQFFT